MYDEKNHRLFMVVKTSHPERIEGIVKKLDFNDKEQLAFMFYPLIRDRKVNMIEASKLIGLKVGEIRDIYAENDLTSYLLTDSELNNEIKNYAEYIHNR